MKALLSYVMLLMSFTTALAQSAKINFLINNTQSNDIAIIRSYPFNNWQEFTNAYSTQELKNGKYVYTMSIAEPTFLTFYCQKDNSRQNVIDYTFFVRPGDNLTFTADFNQPDYGIKVTGKGSQNNQSLLARLNQPNDELFYRDTLPNRILTQIKEHQAKIIAAINRYKADYQPDKEFIAKWQTQAEYYPVATFYSFKENNKYQIREAYKRNFSKWKSVQDSLFATVKLNDPGNLAVPSYAYLLRNFLLREKERLWNMAREEPVAFYKEWYGTTPEKGSLLFQDDMQNLLKEKIINKYFQGKAAEFLYGLLFNEAISEANPQNIPEIFERFKSKFPNSAYTQGLSKNVDEIIKKQQHKLDANMVFVADNGTKLKSFDEVLTLVKGKTVLLDMWGTWCGPCREEIEKNGKYIKDHFKDKGLNYLYIANHDNGNEKKWKELIAYFNMQGIHILANESLNSDIMSKVKGQGYPTYVVINKDGTYELSKAGYPMDRNVLIKQLEEALAK